MSKRLFLVAVLVLLVGYCTRAFAQTAINPQSPITRGEALALVINANPANLKRVQWYASHMPPMPLFYDVDQRQPVAPYIEVAFEQGIIEGNKERLFHPNDYMKEEEAIALVTHYKEVTVNSDSVYLTISKASDSSWLDRVVSEAKDNAIALPFPLHPGSFILRQELFSMMTSAGIDQPQNLVASVIPVTTPLPTNVYNPPVSAGSLPITGNSAVKTVTPVAAQSATQRTYRPVAYVAQVNAQAPSDAQPASASPYLSAKSFAITLPSLGIKDLTIAHPADFSHDGLLAPLKNGLGHLFSYPGQGGKILIYGHSSGYPWDVSKFTKIFRQINKLKIGDKVYVTYNGQLYTYQVSYKQTVDATDTSAYAQGGTEELILYTCWPPDSIKQRYLVHLVPVAN